MLCCCSIIFFFFMYFYNVNTQFVSEHAKWPGGPTASKVQCIVHTCWFLSWTTKIHSGRVRHLPWSKVHDLDAIFAAGRLIACGRRLELQRFMGNLKRTCKASTIVCLYLSQMLHCVVCSTIRTRRQNFVNFTRTHGQKVLSEKVRVIMRNRKYVTDGLNWQCGVNWCLV